MLNYVLKMQAGQKSHLGSDYPFPLGDLIGEFITKNATKDNVVEDIFAQQYWSG